MTLEIDVDWRENGLWSMFSSGITQIEQGPLTVKSQGNVRMTSAQGVGHIGEVQLAPASGPMMGGSGGRLLDTRGTNVVRDVLLMPRVRTLRNHYEGPCVRGLSGA
jgi:hypothetical protein